MSKWATGIAVTVIALPVLYVFIGVDIRPHEEYTVDPEPAEAIDSVPLPPSEYGIPMDGFVLEQGTVRPGATFGDLLGGHGVPMSTVHELVQMAGPHFDVRRMRSGHPYSFIFSSDSTRRPVYFVYESDAVEYVKFRLSDSLGVEVGRRPVSTTEHSISTIVTGALYNDLSRAGADPMLSIILSEIFAWTVDFYRIQKGDVFTVVYREKHVDGERYGLPTVLAARYASGGKVLEGYRFEREDGAQYFDAEGNSLRKAFLKAPLRFSRISSGYSGRRLHPVQKVMKAHLGTDYAAPYGTPIMAVGDGVVEKAGRTGGNGNYVKIRHNATYSTQYLHMRKILARQGQRVKQGDVIGEVGSTGLATGPHVCFRFWKNGVQVDHRKEVFPSADPIESEYIPRFQQVKDSLVSKLNSAGSVVAQARVVDF